MVCVLPVPGGPCTTTPLLPRSRSMMRICSGLAGSGNSGSAPSTSPLAAPSSSSQASRSPASIDGDELGQAERRLRRSDRAAPAASRRSSRSGWPARAGAARPPARAGPRRSPRPVPCGAHSLTNGVSSSSARSAQVLASGSQSTSGATTALVAHLVVHALDPGRVVAGLAVEQFPVLRPGRRLRVDDDAHLVLARCRRTAISRVVSRWLRTTVPDGDRQRQQAVPSTSSYWSSCCGHQVRRRGQRRVPVGGTARPAGPARPRRATPAARTRRRARRRAPRRGSAPWTTMPLLPSGCSTTTQAGALRP